MSKPNGLTNLAVLAVAVLLGVATMASPRVSHDPNPGEFHHDLAQQHLQVIAARPHPLGSPELVSVRDYLVASMEQVGWDTQIQTGTAPDFFGTPGNTVALYNVVARLPGRASTGSILLMAHYDTVPATSGANDNSTPVAALLETARALSAGDPLTNDVIVLFTDAEEPQGRAGAKTFIGAHPWVEDVAFVMNFEAAGGSGPALLVQTGASQAWTVGQLSQATARPVAFSFVTDLVGLFGEVGTDFDPFLARGDEGMHFAYLRGGSIYHTERDSLDAASPDGLVHHGSYALAITRHLGGADLSSPTGEEGSSTFFTVWPGQVAGYPNGAAIAVAVVAVAAAIGLATRDIRSRGLAVAAVLARTSWVLGGAVFASAIGALAWMGIAIARPTMGSVEAYLLMAMLVSVGVGLRLLLTRRAKATDAVSGVMVAWAIVALAVAVTLPGASYLFAWPAIVAAAALMAWPTPGRYGRVARLAIVAIVAGIVLVPAVDVFLALAQPRPGNLDSEMTEAFAVVALIAALCFELLWPFLRKGPEPDDRVEATSPVELATAA